MQINSANLASIFRGYRVLYDQAYQAEAPISDPIVMDVPSSHKQEVYDWLGAVPNMRQLIGDIQIQNLAGITWTITNLPWEETVAVKQEDIETDTYGIYNPLMSAMGASAKQHKDQLTFGLLTGAFSGTASKDYTGSSFFATNKIRQPGDGGFTNYTSNLLNNYAFRAARANLIARLNAKGRPMGLGKKLVLVVGAKNEPVARQILKADTIPQAVGTTGVAGVSNIDQGLADVMVSPYIDAVNPNMWFLLEMGLSIKPIIFQTNKEPTLTSLTNPDSDHVFKNHEFLYQAYGRYNAGYGFPELAYGSDGSGTAPTSYP